MKQRAPLFFLALLSIAFLAACGDDVGHDDHEGHGHSHDENEFMTTVRLTFTPSEGESFTATWANPLQEENPSTNDPINLTQGETYTVTMSFENERENPPENVTPEILQEQDEHQVFFYGDAVQGPAHPDNAEAPISHTYDDADSQGLPVGLTNVFVPP